MDQLLYKYKKLGCNSQKMLKSILYYKNINISSSLNKSKTDGLFIKNRGISIRWQPKGWNELIERKKNMSKKCINSNNNLKRCSNQQRKQSKLSTQTMQYQIIQQLFQCAQM